MGIIKQMVEDAPNQVIQISDSITSLETQISTLQSKQDALEGVCNTVSDNLESYLLNTKFLPVGNYHLFEGVDFNQSLSDTGSFIDWEIYQIILSNIDSSSTTDFQCDGDQTSIFIEGLKLAFQVDSDPILYSIVESSSYSEELDETTVVIEDSILNPDLVIDKIFQLHYTYSAGNDTTIDDYKESWDYTHDYIINPLGLTGTYGIRDMISNLNSAKSMLNIDKSKIDNSIEKLTPFI